MLLLGCVDACTESHSAGLLREAVQVSWLGTALVYQTSSAHAFAAQKTVHRKRVMAAACTELAQARHVHTAVTVAGGVRPHVQGTSGKHPTC